MKAHPEIKTKYLIKLYQEGYSLPEISENVGMTDQAVWERLKKVGIKLRSHSEATKLSYKRGRMTVQTGKQHHSWKGGRNKTKNGYIEITVDKKRYPEHRFIWEQANGKIPKGYIVHHLNGIKDDNRLENLMILPRKHHSPLTITEPYKKRIQELEKIIKKTNG